MCCDVSPVRSKVAATSTRSSASGRGVLCVLKTSVCVEVYVYT